MDVIEDSHPIACVRFADDENNEFKDTLLFCKVIEDRSTAAELFKINNNFFEENKLVWENFTGLCTGGARSMLRKKEDLKELTKKYSPNIILTHDSQTSFSTKNLSGELQNIFHILKNM